MIAHIGQIWLEKNGGNCIVLRELVGGIEAMWIGDYYAGPIGDYATFNIESRNFITGKIIKESELFAEWKPFPGPRP